ncbi:hypothetical protein F5X99DRAFT_382047 [Biscogniauxia marginata]|nr:hypothetical protein F5X99DRAFT_382047 [Biscogniauxia marginata]
MSWNPSDFSPGTMGANTAGANTSANATATADADADADAHMHQYQHQRQHQHQHQYQQQPEQDPSTAAASAPKYTTVGSIYHPQPQPLQPPARRGRTVKSLFPYRNESSSATHQQQQNHHQYSPLQQNFDRAMSPIQSRSRSNLNADFNDAPIAEQESLFPHHFGASYPNMQPAQSPAMSAALQSPDRQEDASIDHEDIDNSQDGHNLRQMTQMNFKSLTNLASYPNPMQKTAQKVLSSHRPLPTSANPLGQQRQPPWNHQASDAMREHKTSVAGMRNARSDPLAMASMLQSDSIDEFGDLNRHSRFGPETTLWTTASRNSTYGAVLSKGPGAPAPLTAGPPGQRQYKPSTLESTMNIPQHGLQRPQDFDDDIPMPNPYNTRIQPQRPVDTVERQSSPSLVSDGVASAQPMPIPNKSNSRVVDTLTAEEASVYYPNGYPPDFNYQTHPVSSRWPLKNSRGGQYLNKNKPEIWASRLAKIERDFYAGSFMINKGFDMAVAEKNSREFSRILGNPCESRNLGKIANRQLTIKEASAISINKHALPLISMAYQTLAIRLELESSNKLPKFNYSN